MGLNGWIGTKLGVLHHLIKTMVQPKFRPDTTVRYSPTYRGYLHNSSVSRAIKSAFRRVVFARTRVEYTPHYTPQIAFNSKKNWPRYDNFTLLYCPTLAGGGWTLYHRYVTYYIPFDSDFYALSKSENAIQIEQELTEIYSKYRVTTLRDPEKWVHLIFPEMDVLYTILYGILPTFYDWRPRVNRIRIGRVIFKIPFPKVVIDLKNGNPLTWSRQHVLYTVRFVFASRFQI